MERSKIVFGVNDPIDLVKVFITPPSFKDASSQGQAELDQFSRNFIEEVKEITVPSIADIEKIQHKARELRDKYLPQKNQNPKLPSCIITTDGLTAQ